MGHAEGRVASHGGPTVCEGASVSIKLQTLYLILTEVKRLTRMNLKADG